MPVTKKTNLAVLIAIPIILGIFILIVGFVIYSNSLTQTPVNKISSASSTQYPSVDDYTYTLDVNVETAKLRTCTSNEIFNNVLLTPAAQDMNFLDSMDSYLNKEEPNTPNINLNAQFAGPNEGSVFHAELFFKGNCKYPLLNYSFDGNNVVDTYFSFNEKKVYFLMYDQSAQPDTKSTKFVLEGYNLEKLAVDSTNNLVLPIPNADFLKEREEGDLLTGIPTKYFPQDSMISISNKKLFLSISPLVGCFGGNQWLCYYQDDMNVNKNLQKEDLSGVYELDINTGAAKKVYSSKLLTSDGILTKIDIVKLTDKDVFSIYLKDIREKVTKL